jgi:hypothetical protein
VGRVPGVVTTTLLATDVSAVLLVVGLAALGVTASVSSLALPSVSVSRRRRRRRRSTSVLPPVAQRRVITGRPAALPPAVPLPAGRAATAGRQTDVRPDDRASSVLRDAEALIERLIDQHPEQIAHMLTAWINAETEEPDTPAALRRPLPTIVDAEQASDATDTVRPSVDRPDSVTASVVASTDPPALEPSHGSDTRTASP